MSTFIRGLKRLGTLIATPLLYGTYKLQKSVTNFFNWHKPGRSFFRVIFTLHGLAVGLSLGGIIGAVVLPIPILGTVVGIIAGVVIGQLVGALIGSTVAAFCTKHLS